MRSKAHFRNHPLHPVLIPFPIAFLIGGTIADFVGRFGELPGWWTAASYVLIAGVATRLLAAVPGIIDSPLRGAAGQFGRKRATKHALANSSALVLFAVAPVISGGRRGRRTCWTSRSKWLAWRWLRSAGGWAGRSSTATSSASSTGAAGKWKETSVERGKATAEGGAAVAKADELKVDQMKLIRLDDGTRIALAHQGRPLCLPRPLHAPRRVSRRRGVDLRDRSVPLARLAVRRQDRQGEGGARRRPLQRFRVEERDGEVRLIL